MNTILTATFPTRARNEERKTASAPDYAATVASASLVAVIFAYLVFSSL